MFTFIFQLPLNDLCSYKALINRTCNSGFLFFQKSGPSCLSLIIPIYLYKKWKYGLRAPVYLEKWRDLTWSRIGLKLNLHHLRKISTGFKMAVLIPKSDIDKIIICAHQKYWILRCKLNFKCKLIVLACYFKIIYKFQK